MRRDRRDHHCVASHKNADSQERLHARQERGRPLIEELEAWLREQRAKLSKNNDTAKAINCSLNRWAAFTRFLDDGRHPPKTI